MNKRFKELAEQSHHRYSEHNIDLEKFAELIVRECAEWMDAEQDEKGDGISDNFYWSARMRLHFGVEE